MAEADDLLDEEAAAVFEAVVAEAAVERVILFTSTEVFSAIDLRMSIIIMLSAGSTQKVG